MVVAAERSLLHARRAGRPREIAHAALLIDSGMDAGPTPVGKAVPRLRELHAEFGHLPSVRLLGVAPGAFGALDGNFDEARSWLEDWGALAGEYGDRWALAQVAWYRGQVERLAGNPAAAERNLREAFEAFSAMGERARLSTLSGELALALADQGKHDEALRFAESSQELGGPDDAATQILWRGARALAGLGQLEEAERAASEAVTIARETDLWWTGDALVTLAESSAPPGGPRRPGRSSRRRSRSTSAKGPFRRLNEHAESLRNDAVAQRRLYGRWDERQVAAGGRR